MALEANPQLQIRQVVSKVNWFDVAVDATITSPDACVKLYASPIMRAYTRTYLFLNFRKSRLAFAEPVSVLRVPSKAAAARADSKNTAT